jgi:hypothetical protein
VGRHRRRAPHHITDVEKRQVTDFVTGEPQTWPNGDAKWQFVFSGTDPDTGDETRFFCKGFQLGAVKEALRAAGVTAGDTLYRRHPCNQVDRRRAQSKTKGMSKQEDLVGAIQASSCELVTDDLI